jgi:hypothetical protein
MPVQVNNFPVLLYKPLVFENRVLRRIFEPRKEEVTGGWRKLHNEELHNVYYPQNIRPIRPCSDFIKENKFDGACSKHMANEGKSYSKDLGIDGSILKLILRKKGRGVVWIQAAQERD